MFINQSEQFLSLISLIDRRGFIQTDTPQLAPPTNGITMYGATQSQQSHMVRLRPDTSLRDKFIELKKQNWVGVCGEDVPAVVFSYFTRIE